MLIHLKLALVDQNASRHGWTRYGKRLLYGTKVYLKDDSRMWAVEDCYIPRMLPQHFQKNDFEIAREA